MARSTKPGDRSLWVGHNPLNVIAPLTWHVCLHLLISLGDLTMLINDPSRGERSVLNAPATQASRQS